MTLRIGILCNDRLALPAVNALLESGMVVAVGMPQRMHEVTLVVQQLCSAKKVPFTLFQKKELATGLTSWLQQYTPDVVLVKTFPWLIPGEVLPVPRHGFINFHYAPLPHFRGPNPLFWMIRSRSATAGVSVHIMDAQFDNGPLLLQEMIPAAPQATYGWLSTQLAYLGLQLTGSLLQALANGTLQAKPQPEGQTGWFRRPQPSDLVIDWQTMPAEEVLALIKACNPWNKGAATSCKGWTFGITEATLLNEISYNNGHGYSITPGSVMACNEQQGLQIACLNGKMIKADVVYCEEGFFPGYRLIDFGIKPNDQLGQIAATPIAI